MIKKLSLSAALAAFMATGALAQSTTPTEPATPPAAPAAPSASSSTSTTTSTTTSTSNVQFKSSMAQSEMLASDLTGMAVRNSAGENLGDINDFVMDSAGKPSVVIIGVGGFLGLGEKDVGVPFEQLAFADAQDGTKVARLDVTKEALTAAPNFVYKDDPKTTASTKTVPSQ
jgi:sporulation protein YlmC with PRC-barrel domain